MSDTDLIERLVAELGRRVPLSIKLWDVAAIAEYLNRNIDSVRQRVVCLPDFPRAIRLPTKDTNGTGQPMWKAAEVIHWVESHKEGAGTRRGA